MTSEVAYLVQSESARAVDLANSILGLYLGIFLLSAKWSMIVEFVSKLYWGSSILKVSS